MKLKKDDIFPREDIHLYINDETHFYPYLHSHDYYEVFFVLSGSILHQLGGEIRKMEAGTVRLIYPQDCHQIDVKEKGSYCNIAFSEETMEKMCALLNIEPPDFSKECVLVSNELLHCMAECKKIAAIPSQKNRNLQMKALLFRCLTHLAEEAVPVREDCPDWFMVLLSRLAVPSVFTLGTREICELAGYTPEYVSRCFRKYLDTTLTDYLLNLRLHYAEGLLLSTNQPILEISLECGFRSLNYFYRCFRNVYGISPNKYRNQNSVLL